MAQSLQLIDLQSLRIKKNIIRIETLQASKKRCGLARHPLCKCNSYICLYIQFPTVLVLLVLHRKVFLQEFSEDTTYLNVDRPAVGKDLKRTLSQLV